MAKRVLKLNVNRVEREFLAEPMDILLDVLRDTVNLTGTKRGCDMGTCGCCTVLVDGEARLSCLTLAAQVADSEITTIEGLGSPERLHPVQRAYFEEGGSQCGFCTPGFVMATVDLLDKNPSPSDAEIREGLSGNLCRCTGYIKIFEAVRRAARDIRAPVKEEVLSVAVLGAARSDGNGSEKRVAPAKEVAQ